MSLQFVLFSLGGRLSRPPFWYAFVATAAVVAAAAYLLMQLSIFSSPLGMLRMPLVYLPAIWIGLALAVKRLHDRDKSAGWLLPFVLLPSLLAQVAFRMVAESSGLGTAILPAAAAALLALWGFVEIALMPGTEGSNRFGPDPREAVADSLD